MVILETGIFNSGLKSSSIPTRKFAWFAVRDCIISPQFDLIYGQQKSPEKL
jgi:hypothetical protein